ncbi:MAG: DUF1080 domain-containing protein [Acidobacteriota bacterium]|nr:DUF1080 domain-containing protein [Acidobacteriota bacterium]
MRRNRSRTAWLTVGLLAVAVRLVVPQAGDPKLTEVWEPVPAVVDPGGPGKAPSDAVVLFDGRDLSEWRGKDGDAPWTVGDGAMTVAAGTGDIVTRRAFGDAQVHLEWRTPSVVRGVSQERGNSGVFLMERYEVQVLDSYENPTYANGQAASVYKQFMPLVNVARPPGVWQTYDIVFGAPRFKADGALDRPATLTVLHNGVLVQNHVTLEGATTYIGKPSYSRHAGKAPLMLQDHGNPVSFRNIWVREL